MPDVEAMVNRLGIDLSRVDWDSIQIPPGEDFGIRRYQTLTLVLTLRF